MVKDLSMGISLLRRHAHQQIQMERRRRIQKERTIGRLNVSYINASDVFLPSPSSQYRPRTYGTQRQLTVIRSGTGTLGTEVAF